MKIAQSVVVLAASVNAKDMYKAPKGVDANGNKINGRHPQRRLQAINKFMCSWMASNVEENKAQRMCNRFSSQMEKYSETFERETCAFFDPAVKNGGPNPDESMRGMRPAKNPNAKNKFVQRRLRRDDDDEEEDEDAVDQQALEDCDGTETGAFAQFCQTEGQARAATVSQRKLKRYTTSLMKWCERYISECHGQRVHQHCINRGMKLYNQLTDSQ